MPIDNRVNMFFNAKPGIFEKAKALRKNMTTIIIKPSSDEETKKGKMLNIQTS
jgi:hypothetical protein